MPETREAPLATAAEVAEYLRTTTAKLANDRYRGIGPRFIKNGRHVLYRWEDVHAYIESRLMTRTNDRPGVA